jgi:hypothetical protein
MEKKKRKFQTGTLIANMIVLACLGVIIFGLGVMAYFIIRALIAVFF